ncbi:Ppx/GppA phosphatase family protein [Phyllobacterium myrsinacearum]|uniref:Exopolyphosphatase/guanosine-5'-triphosphate, 3'-diphosphate pyrophosphatase n=1 Tax=Phyllobacterium myrsinacearum TaxID=28101 RepID=A0A839EAT5_9HYPH|nr:Ppx/GppA phosphatase family protein [Phyllobacterium myrsinacearum]MBA8876991.1 exopolyphosphatase/guanosine-5'-triphosphate,3'-diphosphate pyrophosphatase [Phyllobacterium myrsinacearum]
MKDPESDARKASNEGASGGHPVSNSTAGPAKNGPGPHADSARQSQESQPDSQEGRFDKNPKKRARRRRRGKSKHGAVSTANTVVTTTPADPAAEAGTPALAKTGKKRRPNRHRRRGRSGAKQQEAIVAATVEQSGPIKSPEPADTARREPKYAGAPLYAALDLGTNNCRLLVATPTRPGQFRVIDAFSRIVRLGEGLGATGRLSPNAMSRAIEALKICRDKLENHDVRRARLIATEACRQAENGAEFLDQVKHETGLDLEIINRQTEARLAVSGCGTLVERETDAVVLFDIGGGSSEIALIDVSERRSPRLAEHIIAWTSLPVGVVTLAERFGGRDVTTDNFAVMVNHVAELLNDFSERHKLGDLVNSQNFHLLGTSGTVTTLAGIHLGLDRYDRRRIDGIWMQNDDVTEMTSKLLSWSFDERVANPCIGADRADLVLAGCAILDAIRNVWPSQKLRVADRGLREGILTELMSRDGAWRNRWFRANVA